MSSMTEKQTGEKDATRRSVSSGGEAVVEYHIDPAEEKAVLRKIDWIVMPAMTFVYFFQYLDKQTINYASVFGLNSDLNLTGTQFSWVVTLFYFGQLTSEFPASYLMSRFPVTKVVGVTIVLWGVCEMCMGAAQSFGGVAAVRYCLGLCEGSASPAWVIITSNWYTRKEHPNRVAIWTSMSGVAQILGAILMYLIGQAPPMAIANWRVMFLICGSVTIVSGIIFIFCVPVDGSTAWFFNEREKQVAVERLARDRATRDKANFNPAQAKEALLDVGTWLLFLMALFICIPSPILKFSSLVINGFGFSKFNTMLVGLPSGAMQIITVWVFALGMRYTNNYRWIWGLFATTIPLIGSILLLCLPASNDWGIVVSTWLAAQSSDLIVVTLSLVASNVKGNTKKSVVNAVYFVGYSVGCISGPQLWQAKDAPRYRKGCISSIVSWCLLYLCFLAYFALCKRENKKRDRLCEATVVDDAAGTSVGSDLTDKQDLNFRYKL
ncbi:MFS general substrate transporter [Pleurostoma richardsiae]|uniref:MFS general substrate transporter n=1 Tax=Pleurostoma richardsiae TaxID=41990 RepID=A0AA38RSA7_9PEZI|nr:MFS general substrate transporter [Pleurostoma richardsiae]